MVQLYLVLQAQRWCDDGAYLLANQQVDKFQSKEGAQTALRDIEKFQEAAPPLLGAGTDVLFLEFESVLTPYLQVNTGRLQKRLDSFSSCLMQILKNPFYTVITEMYTFGGW